MLAVYHGRQTNQEEYRADDRTVYMYPSCYLTNGGEITTRVVQSGDTNKIIKEYSITDHLGSVRSVVYTEGDSLAIKSYDYKPFGENSWTNGGTNEKGFAGSDNEIEQRYKWFGARQYDPKLGRFLSVDPLFEMFPEHSPYHYAYNNPLSYIDPSGMNAVLDQDVEISYGIGWSIVRFVDDAVNPGGRYVFFTTWNNAEFGEYYGFGYYGGRRTGAYDLEFGGSSGRPSGVGYNAEKTPEKFEMEKLDFRKKTPNYSNAGSSGNAGNKFINLFWGIQFDAGHFTLSNLWNSIWHPEPALPNVQKGIPPLAGVAGASGWGAKLAEALEIYGPSIGALGMLYFSQQAQVSVQSEAKAREGDEDDHPEWHHIATFYGNIGLLNMDIFNNADMNIFTSPFNLIYMKDHRGRHTKEYSIEVNARITQAVKPYPPHSFLYTDALQKVLLELRFEINDHKLNLYRPK